MRGSEWPKAIFGVTCSCILLTFLAARVPSWWIGLGCVPCHDHPRVSLAWLKKQFVCCCCYPFHDTLDILLSIAGSYASYDLIHEICDKVLSARVLILGSWGRDTCTEILFFP